MLKSCFKSCVALLALSLVFVGAPRCIPTANLLNQIWEAVGHGHHTAEEISADSESEGSEHAIASMGQDCPHHSSPSDKNASQVPHANFFQDFMSDGAGCHCQVNAFVNATPVNDMQPKVVHVVVPRAQEIEPPVVKTLLTQITYVPEAPPPKTFAS